MHEDGWARDAACRIERHDSVGSTNTLALERARAGADAPLWIVAGEQTAGRGRHARHWHSPPGNLYASRLVVLAIPAARMTGLAFVAAIALHDAVQPLLPEGARASLSLKWPNDLMAGAAKLAGILVEAEALAPRTAAAVGIGVNISERPLDGRAASLASLGADTTPEATFARLGPSFEARLAEWDEGRGFAATRAAWLTRAAESGTPASVRTGEGSIAGRFAGLAEDGALLLELASGAVRRIAAGEVVMDGDRR